MNQRKVELVAGSTVATTKVYSGSIDCAVQVCSYLFIYLFPYIEDLFEYESVTNPFKIVPSTLKMSYEFTNHLSIRVFLKPFLY